MLYYPRMDGLDLLLGAAFFLQEEAGVARALVGLKVKGEVRGLEVDHQNEADRKLD